MTIEELREQARQADIRVWPADAPRFKGDDAKWRYRRGSIEVGSIAVETEEQALRSLLSR